MGNVVAISESKGQAVRVELRKPQAMVVLLPRTAGMTLIGRRLYTALLQFSQAQLVKMDEMPPATFMFEAPLVAMLRVGGGDDSHARTLAKRYFKAMKSLAVDWESTVPGDGLKYSGFNMLAQCDIEVRDGQNWLRWAFPPAIMGALKEPTLWAHIDLAILFRLNRYASHALYEICSKYRTNPSGKTAWQPVTWWEAALSVEPREAMRSDWRKFKFRAVKEAVLEINAETDLEIELFEKKEGRLVTEVQFAVRRKRASQVGSQQEAPIDTHLMEYAGTLGIPESRLDRFLLEFGEVAVRIALSGLGDRLSNKKLGPVKSPNAWLSEVLRAQKETRTEPAPAAAPSSEAAGGEASVPTARALTTPSVGPDAARTQQLKSEIAALPPQRRQELGDQAAKSLLDRKLLTPSIARRAKQGDFMVGILGVEVVRLYGLQTYGGDWHQMEVLEAVPPAS